MKQSSKRLFTKLLVASALAAMLVGCGSVAGETLDAGDAGPGLAPQESQALSSAAGRVQGGSLVFDVEIGVGVSRTPTANASMTWTSDSPTVP